MSAILAVIRGETPWLRSLVVLSLAFAATLSPTGDRTEESVSSVNFDRPDPACCYFSAMDKDVKQPGQKAFLTWDPVEKIESFTVQPLFEGNAQDFGMVVPTPSRPRLQEAHRDFFKALAVFTILKPMNPKKFKPMRLMTGRGGAPGSAGVPSDRIETKRKVRVLEAGVVGSLDYKILEADDASALFEWLAANKYQYRGDQETLQFYIQRGWTFTVMKIDPKQMRLDEGGKYKGEVTPTRFTFESEKLIYPLRITRISVPDKTEALFYVLSKTKMDLPERFSYQPSFQSMWTNAFQWANWDLCTTTEVSWWKHLEGKISDVGVLLREHKKRFGATPIPTLEYARRLTADDVMVMQGLRPFDRQAPADEVKGLAKLAGTLREGLFLTKCRAVITRDAMGDDLEFRKALFLGQEDEVEHIEILPTSPP